MNANTNLQLYPLPASIVAYLNRVDETAARFGSDAPRVIGMNRDDFATVDTIVRRVSHDKATGRSVTWKGRQLVPVAA